jgi:ABC-type transport system involved in cytochrome c biogenesis permease subunit
MTALISSLLFAALVLLIGLGAVGLGAMLLRPRRAVALDTPVGGVHTTGGDRAALARGLVAGVLVACAALSAAVLLRATLVGHAPWSNLHEFSIAFAAALLGAYLLLARSQPIAGLAPFAALLAAGVVAFAIGLESRVDPLVPALQQPLLLTVHVGAAVIAYAVSGVAFIAAAAELGQRASGDGIGLLPSASIARRLSQRAVLIAFPILTVAIALGSVWANLAWRSYWSNDPKELAAAATWLVFGAYLHVAARRYRWERLAPWLIVLGFAGVLFTYIGAGLFIVGEHSYGSP